MRVNIPISSSNSGSSFVTPRVNRSKDSPVSLPRARAAFFAALLNIYLRKLGNSDKPISTALWYNITGACIFTLVFIFSKEVLFRVES